MAFQMSGRCWVWPPETQASCTPWDAFLLFTASSVQACSAYYSRGVQKTSVIHSEATHQWTVMWWVKQFLMHPRTTSLSYQNTSAFKSLMQFSGYKAWREKSDQSESLSPKRNVSVLSTWLGTILCWQGNGLHDPSQRSMIHSKYREQAWKCVVTCSGTLPAITAQPPARDNPNTFTGVLWEQAFSVGSHERRQECTQSLKGLCATMPSSGNVTVCAVLKHGFF